MKVFLLCCFLGVLAIVGLLFWDDYGRLFIHEQHLRTADTNFYQFVCEDVKVAAKIGSSTRCHDIVDRHALSIHDVAWRKAIDKYTAGAIQCFKALFVDSNALFIVGATVIGIALCLRLLTFLHPRPHAQFSLPHWSPEAVGGEDWGAKTPPAPQGDTLKKVV